MPKVRSSKDTVYYRHGAWGSMRLNTFDYQVIKAGYFTNQTFTAAKLMRCSHVYGAELPHKARIQVVPMYTIEQEEDGAFVKMYIRKSNNVHCLVMDKNAVDALLKITRKPVKRHSVVAYVPRIEATVSVQGKKEEDCYEVISIVPMSTVVAIKHEGEIFVLPNGRRLEQNVGKPPRLDISARERTTVIALDKEPRPTASRLRQLDQTEFLERRKSGLRTRQNPEVSGASGTSDGPSRVQERSSPVVEKVLTSMPPPPPPLPKPTRSPVRTRNRASMREPTPIKIEEVIVVSDEDEPIAAAAPPVVIREEKPSKRRNTENKSDPSRWIDASQFETRYDDDRETIPCVRQENEETLSPSPKRARLGKVKFVIEEEDPWIDGVGDTQTKKGEENAVLLVSASQNLDSSRIHDSPMCRETDYNLSSVYSVYSFDFSTIQSGERTGDRLLVVQQENRGEEEEKVVCRPECPSGSIDPRNCVRERKPDLNVRIVNDIDECNPLARFVRTFKHGAQFFDDWLSKSASKRVMPE